ncbi:hypothetical protein V502_07089 [Pseudogymnoascus sp. VKM F-4520 (FW-2644)]|nr:hypothetical protein V502_07089 [Pseudogymnoascus sp. VKM F-4520 (FW-2644)]
MDRFPYHNKNPSHVQSTYSGVQKTGWQGRWKRGDRESIAEMRARLRREIEEERKARAPKGPSPAQRLRRVELLAEKANYLNRFTAINAMITASKEVVDAAVAHYKNVKEEKRQLEEKYREILAELGRIPAELSSSEGGMPRNERDIVKDEEEGANVMKQEGGNIMRGEGEEVTIKEEEGDMI